MSDAGGRLPYYKRYPGDFLLGIAHMTVEQIAVYAVLLDLMYDGWETIEDRTVKQRRDLARTCGLSVRKFGTTLEELIVADKIQRTLSGRLSNRKFQQLAKDRGVILPETSQKNGKNARDNRGDNRADNDTASNGNNGLEGQNTPVHARAKLEARSQKPEQNSAEPGSGASKPGLGDAAEQVIETEITTICRAIGVMLTASTKRHGWPAQWVRMRTELDLTVDDMVAAIDSYPAQFKGDSVRSLGLFKDRAIERRQARVLGDRIAGRTTETKAVTTAAISVDQWTEMLTTFIRIGSWDRAKFGPSPLEDGCIVPIAMLDNAERYWIKNGNHPEFTLNSGGRVPWHAGTQHGSVTEITPFYRSRSKS